MRLVCKAQLAFAQMAQAVRVSSATPGSGMRGLVPVAIQAPVPSGWLAWTEMLFVPPVALKPPPSTRFVGDPSSGDDCKSDDE